MFAYAIESDNGLTETRVIIEVIYNLVSDCENIDVVKWTLSIFASL